MNAEQLKLRFESIGARFKALEIQPRWDRCREVLHRDHATIRLNEWHRVIMNTETQSQPLANVAFLD